ncbi:PD-(D/E)XK nuclease family protein [bacterium CPR1]|nr:PD-(D/E)XK nuclease family protein [bacterium CPR1]
MEQLGLFGERLEQPASPTRRRPRTRAMRPLLPPLPEGPPRILPDTSDKILDGLTEAQEEAVCHGTGPLLIVAGAGTGKTTVVTRRIAYLIASGAARPAEILALTFTDKAAAEMQERVDMLLPYGYADIQISTFHSFGDRVLRENAMELGITPDFKVLSQPEQVLFLQDHLFELPLDRYRPLGNPTGHLQALLSLFSRAKDEDVSPADYLALAERLTGAAADPDSEDRARTQTELARVYAAYQELMSREGFLDFGDQVYLMLRLFRQRPSVLGRFQKRFRFILVDEFQDTNYAQFQLVKQLAAARRNLTVVGDDDQSIYKFRGASISNILQFTEEYPEVVQVVLKDNFRSTQLILDASYRLIVHNNPDRLEVRNQIDKRLVSPREEGPEVEHRAFDNLSAESEQVAEEIRRLVEEGACRYGDCAILVRTNKDADPYLRGLNMLGIPFRFTGNRGLYARPEIRLVMAFLRCLCDPHDSVSLFYLASGETYRLPMNSLVLLNSYAMRRNLPLLQVMREHAAETPPEDQVTLSAEDLATVQRLLDEIDRFIGRIADESPGRLLYHYITESGWLGQLTENGGEVEIQNLARFFDILKSFEENHPQALLPQFVQHLDLLMQAGDSPAVVEADAEEDAVQLLTVHRSKGLEFPVVFMVGLVDGKFPSRNRPDPIEFPAELVRESLSEGDFHMQEERRLFYVGMTRAKERLVMTWSRDVGGRRARKASPFLLEALDRPRADAAAFRASPLVALERFAPPPAVSGAQREMSCDRVLNLSFRQIDDYLTCALKYKYIHILRVPILQHHSVAYGRALHEAISEYLVGKKEGRQVTLEAMLARYESCWVSQGFLTREHEEQRFTVGRTALEQFHAREERAGVKPAMVEQDFAFTVDSNRVIGRWDRVDEGPVIVDYKSSEVRTQADADRRARESLQLALYALAHRETYAVTPKAVELHFLEAGLVGRAEPKPRDLTKAREKVLEAAAGIRSRNFAAAPTFMACRTCAYREICPATAT